MKFTDYEHFMIVSRSTAIMLQDNLNFTVSIPEPVECDFYPHANLTMVGCYIVHVPITEEYPNGQMVISIYVDNYLPFINPNGK